MHTVPQPTNGTPAPRIYWLSSYPCSGDEWVRGFLHSLNELRQGRSGEVDLDRVETYGIAEASVDNFTPFLANPEDVHNFTALTAIRPQAQARLAERANGPVFVATHLAALELDKTPAVNTEVTRGATYLVRNPLDVACLLSERMGWTIDRTIEVMGTVGYCFSGNDAVPEPLSSWSHHVESWTRRDQAAVNVMRYEDILSMPVRTFGRFLRHAGFRPGRQRLIRAIALSRLDRLRGQVEFVPLDGAADGASRPRRRERWREILSKDQVDAIVAAHRDQMERFGYLEGL